MKNKEFRRYIIYVIVLNLLRLVNFENMITCCLALIITLLITIVNNIKN